MLRRATPPRVYHPLGGRPPTHGGDFVFGAPDTWGAEQAVTTTDIRLYGTATAQAWDRLHPRLTRRSAWVAHTESLPIIAGTVIPLQVEHLPSGGVNKPVWLWFSGIDADVDRCWQAFLRRFDIEHTFGLLTQTLGWSTPKLRDLDSADRWTWSILAVYTQLRLARHLATDLPRPWEPPAPPSRLTPARVRRGFRNIRAKTPHQRMHRNLSDPAPDALPVHETAVAPHVTTWDASSLPARPTPAPPTTRRAPNPDEPVKRQAYYL